ncbi:hypothetical protein BCR33DRAFT_849711 [Rhizoclosmatium globosum]|uniref:Uncharacterized protein n=1 Tax=Rhizoclosmatium globosum TaxID=329046 RepID=A0A1Y2CGC8_9FUNG|nr:hypothetical protein BCR33DRAFT_849711 [Rhizoclosmatium globosum]|eukprot:ORY46108.1 hypothetical protein BCR33DRAFT_849711 [Rhizoclosmatium globosum]
MLSRNATTIVAVTFCDATRANCKARAYKEHIQKCGNPMTDEMLEWANPDFFKAFPNTTNKAATKGKEPAAMVPYSQHGSNPPDLSRNSDELSPSDRPGRAYQKHYY